MRIVTAFEVEKTFHRYYVLRLKVGVFTSKRETLSITEYKDRTVMRWMDLDDPTTVNVIELRRN